MSTIRNAENLVNRFPKSDFAAGLQKRVPVTTSGVALGLHAIEAEAPGDVRKLNNSVSQPAFAEPILRQQAETALQQEPPVTQSASFSPVSVYPTYPAEPTAQVVPQETAYDKAAHEQASRDSVLESLGATASDVSDSATSPIIGRFNYVRNHPRPNGEQNDQLNQQFGSIGYTTDMKQSDLDLAA
jgi:hypothetical protein